jgi:glycosyltransferase family protein
MGFRNIIRNLRFLYKNDIKALEKDIRSINIDKIYNNFNCMIDNIYYEIDDEFAFNKRPKIKDVWETVEKIISDKSSICRFGDGEINLLNGDSIRFQKSNALLSNKLKEVLQSNNDKILIGINYHYYNNLKNCHSFVKLLNRTVAHHLRKIQDKYLSFDRNYYSANFTLVYNTYEHMNFDLYYERVKKIWDKRDVTLICGDRIFNNIDYNIFENCNTFKTIHAPSSDAFTQYDSILKKAKETDKDNLVLIILGPTGTVLAYDLAMAGYQAIDIGHLAKDYDAYRKNSVRTKDSITDFFKPD